MLEKKVAWASPMSAAVNAVAQAIKERRAERERSAKLTVLQRLAAEDAETAAKEPKKKARGGGAKKKVVGALAIGAAAAGSAAHFGRVRLHDTPREGCPRLRVWEGARVGTVACGSDAREQACTIRGTATDDGILGWS